MIPAGGRLETRMDRDDAFETVGAVSAFAAFWILTYVFLAVM